MQRAADQQDAIERLERPLGIDVQVQVGADDCQTERAFQRERVKQRELTNSHDHKIDRRVWRVGRQAGHNWEIRGALVEGDRTHTIHRHHPRQGQGPAGRQGDGLVLERGVDVQSPGGGKRDAWNIGNVERKAHASSQTVSIHHHDGGDIEHQEIAHQAQRPGGDDVHPAVADLKIELPFNGKEGRVVDGVTGQPEVGAGIYEHAEGVSLQEDGLGQEVGIGEGISGARNRQEDVDVAIHMCGVDTEQRLAFDEDACLLQFGQALTGAQFKRAPNFNHASVVVEDNGATSRADLPEVGHLQSGRDLGFELGLAEGQHDAAFELGIDTERFVDGCATGQLDLEDGVGGGWCAR